MNSVADFFQKLFNPIVNLMGEVLKYFHYELDIPWWLSIAILTIILRTLLFPLTFKQVKSMRAMQDLKPEIDRIRAQFKGNRQRQQEETMKLYQERKVNPLGGCLPVLIQMPVFIGIFYVIRQFGGTPHVNSPTEPSFNHGGILWFQDLSHMDPYLILPIVSALTMLAGIEITSKSVEPQQRWLMRVMPLGFTIFLWRFPAGLFVYWITSNLVTLAQNYLIYNQGPAKKSSDSDKRFHLSGKTKAPRTETKENNEHEDQGKKDLTAGMQKTKRKRRKKK